MDAISEDAVSPLTRTEQAHRKYREGQYQQALQLYSGALSIATLSAHRIALYSNRAACYLKLQKFKEAAAECSAILELDHSHKGALMLRAQTLVALKDYQSALFDVNRLLSLNPMSHAYRDFHARLRTQLALAPIPEAENESHPPESPTVNQETSIFEPNESHIDRSVPLNSSKADPSNAVDLKGSSIKGKTEVPEKLLLSKNLTAQFYATTVAAQTEASASPTFSSPAVFVSENKEPIPREGAASLSDGWKDIPKPKGHTGIDYSRWSGIGDDLSDDENDEDFEPKHKYRLRTIGLRAVNHPN